MSSGCDAYAEMRAQRPADDVLVQSPLPVVQWIGETDARMTGACR